PQRVSQGTDAKRAEPAARASEGHGKAAALQILSSGVSRRRAVARLHLRARLRAGHTRVARSPESQRPFQSWQRQGAQLPRSCRYPDGHAAEIEIVDRVFRHARGTEARLSIYDRGANSAPEGGRL